jgi:hypothetical protein
MNGARGASDVEGKAAMGCGERRGSGASFNTNPEPVLPAETSCPFLPATPPARERLRSCQAEAGPFVLIMV